VKVGGRYLTKVGVERATVLVLWATKVNGRARFTVERVDVTPRRLLPKSRTAASLHPIDSAESAWPSMTEKQD
jgi:hypothetical protein